MKIKAKNIKLKIEYFVLTFLYMKPMIISIMPRFRTINSLLNLIQIGLTLSIVLFIALKKRIKNMTFWGPMFGLIGWMTLSNWTIGKSGISFILEGLSLIAFLLIVENAFKQKQESVMFESMMFYFILITLLNLYSQLRYGINGIYHDWENSWQAYYVCGNANSFVFFYLTGVGISMAYSWTNRKGQIISYAYHLIVLYSLYYSYSIVNSSTGLVILSGLFICRIFFLDNVKKIIVKYYKPLLLIAFAGFTWLILMDGWKSKWLLDFLNRSLNENKSFIERGAIWHNAVENILSKPIFGYGSGAVRISSDTEGVLRSAHNNYLQLMIQGGIPELIFYFILIWKCVKRHNELHRKEDFDVSIVITFFLFSYLFEQNPFYIGFYLFLLLSFLIKNENIRFND